MGKNYSFCANGVFDEDRMSRQLPQYREHLFNKFNRNMKLLLESKKPRKQWSHKGRLDTRKVYQYQFNENIFQKTLSQPSSDTTIIMLIDGSGSMGNRVDAFDTHFQRIEVCNAICSAFAKSVKTVLNDELKVEVFLKSAPYIHGKGAVKGDFVTLTRVFSNSVPQVPSKYDKLLSVRTRCPVKVGDSYEGSYTAEYSVLPALQRWMKKNIKTKSVVFFNLTDGEAYATLGKDGRRFDNKENAYMRTKYLRGENEMTMIIGENPAYRKSWIPVYGNNLIVADDNFEPEMFKTLMKLMESSYE